MRIAFTTVGCRLNQFETDALRGHAQHYGHEVVPFEAEADAYVINTCTITAQADADSRQLARRAVHRNPAAIVAVTGCYAQAAPDRVAAIPGVDLVLGNQEKAGLLAALIAFHKTGAPTIQVGDMAALRRMDAYAYGPGIAPDRTRAFLKIQDGCNYRCSFCVVPQVRGANRSQTPDRVRAEIARLQTGGFPEVVLTGIHLGTYGRDLTPKTTLPALCRQILETPDGPRIRLSSLDPHEVTAGLISLFGTGRLCRHLHLPLQSGDEGILRRMRRGHTAAQFRSLVEEATCAVPGLAVTADVIVGFPGEDDEAFRHTYELLDGLPIAGLHVFSYSRRPGTDAATYPDQVDRPIIRERSQALRSLAARKVRAFRECGVGEAVEVVVLRSSADLGALEGLSDNYLRVWFTGDAELIGGRAWVRVEATTPDGVRGVLCPEPRIG